RMMVRYQDFADGPAGHAAAEQAVPGFLRMTICNAGVDDIPCVAVVDQIDVDVVEAEREGDAGPEHAGGNLQPLAGRGRLLDHDPYGGGRLRHAAPFVTRKRPASDHSGKRLRRANARRDVDACVPAVAAWLPGKAIKGTRRR